MNHAKLVQGLSYADPSRGITAGKAPHIKLAHFNIRLINNVNTLV